MVDPFLSLIRDMIFSSFQDLSSPALFDVVVISVEREQSGVLNVVQHVTANLQSCPLSVCS